MNYTGGKARILPFLLDLFPKEIDCFYDLFCGGLNVSLNAESQRVVANDVNTRLMDIYRNVASFDSFDSLDKCIRDSIARYGLHCQMDGDLIDGVEGTVESVSREGYERLRDAYNSTGDPLLLLVLVFYSFNNCIRFNRQFQFNMPIGKSCYNAKNREELMAMHHIVRSRGFEFTSKSFDGFPLDAFNDGDFVYFDPPYLITDAVYNESNNDESGWTEKEEAGMYDYIDSLDARGIRFGLSNAVMNNGKTNGILNGWMRKYRVFYPDIKYTNASYQRRNRDSETVEVYVTNVKEAVDRRLSQEILF